MVLGMPKTVLRPAATGSPGWVHSVVGVAVTTWSNHPVQAATSAVWIQLGIGLFLLVAPRGRWSRVAGVVSAVWALVVWVFGEALGAVFAPGLTVAFGAPARQSSTPSPVDWWRYLTAHGGHARWDGRSPPGRACSSSAWRSCRHGPGGDSGRAGSATPRGHSAQWCRRCRRRRSRTSLRDGCPRSQPSTRRTVGA